MYAPIDGIVEACDVTENATVGTADVLFTITNKQRMLVTFHVSADAAKAISLGDHVTLESGKDSYTGTITEIGTMVESNGLFKLKAAIDEGTLPSGVSVKVTANTADTHGLLIPQSVIYYEDGQGYVYVHENGTAVKTYIETGVVNDEYAEILSGLEADSEVIVTWNPNIRDGSAVEAVAVNTEMPQENAAPENPEDLPTEESPDPQEASREVRE